MNNTQPRWVAVVLAILTAVTALVIAISNNSDNIVKVIHTLSPAQKAAVTRAIVASPNRACNPALGTGTMGVCAPPTAPFNPLLGAPRVLHGILGVDVSSYQGCSNSFVGVRFVITKFNESNGYRDQCAAHNIAVALSRHLPHGGYDFLRPGRTSAAVEASVFVGMYRATHARGVAVADVEASTIRPSLTRAYVSAWVAWVHHALPNVTIIIYTGKWFWDPSVGGPAGTLNLWVSAYANSFLLPVGFRSALIWQYSDGRFGAYPRINGWDSDIFLGSEARFAAVFHGAPPPKPISAYSRRSCNELNHLRHVRRVRLRHKQYPTLTKRQRRRASHIKRSEKHWHVVCDSKGAHR